jgi:hypothetical protein
MASCRLCHKDIDFSDDPQFISYCFDAVKTIDDLIAMVRKAPADYDGKHRKVQKAKEVVDGLVNPNMWKYGLRRTTF